MVSRSRRLALVALVIVTLSPALPACGSQPQESAAPPAPPSGPGLCVGLMPADCLAAVRSELVATPSPPVSLVDDLRRRLDAAGFRVQRVESVDALRDCLGSGEAGVFCSPVMRPAGHPCPIFPTSGSDVVGLLTGSSAVRDVLAALESESSDDGQVLLDVTQARLCDLYRRSEDEASRQLQQNQLGLDDASRRLEQQNQAALLDDIARAANDLTPAQRVSLGQSLDAYAAVPRLTPYVCGVKKAWRLPVPRYC